jgi:hypothetical protein
MGASRHLVDATPQRLTPPQPKPWQRPTPEPTAETIAETCENCHAEPATYTTDTHAMFGCQPPESRRVCAGCYVFPRSYPQRMGYRPRSGEPVVAALLHPDDPEPLMCDSGPEVDPTPRWER